MLIIIEPPAEHLAFVLMPQLQHGACAMENMPSALTSLPLGRVVINVT
jgi:hypothetical protein